MVIEGKLAQILSFKHGVSSKGAWSKQDFLIKTMANFPKEIMVTGWMDMVLVVQSLHIGDQLKPF